MPSISDQDRKLLIVDKYISLRALIISVSVMSDNKREWVIKKLNELIVALFYEILISFSGTYEGKRWDIETPDWGLAPDEIEMMREYRNLVLHVPDDFERFKTRIETIRISEPFIKKIYHAIELLAPLLEGWGESNPEIIHLVTMRRKREDGTLDSFS